MVNDQRDAQSFNVFIYIFNSLHVSSTSCSSSGETNCVNTTSGSGGSVVCNSEVHFRPARDTATDKTLQLSEVVLTQFVPPHDEHDVLETSRELKI